MREQSESYRQQGAQPIERWRMVAHPLPSDIPPPAGAIRLLSAHWAYDISQGEA